MPNFTENITLPNVAANQSITVIDKSLTIQGDVGSGAIITLKSSQSNIKNQINCGGSVVIISNNVNIGSAGHKLTVQGNVHGRANITCSSDMEFRSNLSDHVKVKTVQGSIIVKGNVGSNTTIESTSGNVSTGNVGSNTTIKSTSGNVSTGNVGSNTTIESISGNVSARNVGSNTTLKSINGNVSVLSHHSSAIITTMSGKCYVNGRQNSNNRATNAIHIDSNFNLGNNFFDMNNFSNFNFFPSGTTGTTTSIINGRVFINGAEQGSTSSQTQNSHASANSPSSSNTMPAVLQSYINDFKGESFQDAFKRLKVNAIDKYSFLNISCIISQDIPNIPVSLNGHLYDWCSLKSQIEKNGYKDPMTRETFTLKQVIPDRTTRNNLEGILKNEKEMHKSNIATCSSSGFKR